MEEDTSGGWKEMADGWRGFVQLLSTSVFEQTKALSERADVVQSPSCNGDQELRHLLTKRRRLGLGRRMGHCSHLPPSPPIFPPPPLPFCWAAVGLSHIPLFLPSTSRLVARIIGGLFTEIISRRRKKGLDREEGLFVRPNKVFFHIFA